MARCARGWRLPATARGAELERDEVVEPAVELELGGQRPFLLARHERRHRVGVQLRTEPEPALDRLISGLPT